jgi:hypothetical protein
MDGITTQPHGGEGGDEGDKEEEFHAKSFNL